MALMGFCPLGRRYLRLVGQAISLPILGLQNKSPNMISHKSGYTSLGTELGQNASSLGVLNCFLENLLRF